MSFDPSKKLRVLVLCQESLIPPDSLEGYTEAQILNWKTEYDVIRALRGMGHEVYPVGISNELGVIHVAIDDYTPHVAFNLIEEFDGYPLFDQHVVSYLELMRQKYTGCNPRGLTLARDKALTKKILAYHRIHVPAFAVFPIARKVRRPKRLKFPLLVKSATQEGSVGISQASVVHNDEKLAERVEFIHRKTYSDAIAEQYIEGREIYVGLMGNNRIQTFTPWEHVLENLPEGAHNIATYKLKWNPEYQRVVGFTDRPAALAPELERRLLHISRRIYRLLMLSGYARLDYRMTADGQFYLLEANPNPNIAHGDYFSDSAKSSGLEYGPLLQKIMMLGMSYEPTQF
ncbi:MAG: D-alanine--D-alanine ligase [Acidobacteria bacterium]|nr:MAG: D-alanine--D-alanine ligase [Acidobacteriota bacterium]